MVSLLDKQICQVNRWPRGQPPPDLTPMGKARFEQLAGTVDVALTRLHVAQHAQREAGVAVRARRLDTGEYLLSPRPSRIVVAVVESDLRHPEPGERLHP